MIDKINKEIEELEACGKARLESPCEECKAKLEQTKKLKKWVEEGLEELNQEIYNLYRRQLTDIGFYDIQEKIYQKLKNDK